MTQHDEIKKLYELTQAHPDLPVVYCYHQEFYDSDYEWMLCHEILSRVGHVYKSPAGHVCTEYRDIMEDIREEFNNGNRVPLSKIKGIFRSGKLYRAIIVEVSP